METRGRFLRAIVRLNKKMCFVLDMLPHYFLKTLQNIVQQAINTGAI